MRGLRAAFTGLGTKVATRTFLTFALCAVAPIALLAFISHRTVSAELRDVATERLTHASKAYGLLIFERLRQSSELLGRLAEAYLRGQGSESDLRDFSSRRIRVIDVRSGAQADPGAPGVRLYVLAGEPQQGIALSTTRVEGEARVTVTGLITPSHLWDADAVELAGVQLCVRKEADTLHCAGEPVAEPALAANWDLFLRPVYGADSWTIEARQQSASALATVHRFTRTLPIAAGVALGLALLLSVMQIRRSHRPLAVLTQAALRIGARRPTPPVVLEAGDEYGTLALAFNRMAANVTRQFHLMAALARIDRMILGSPSIATVIEKTVHELPRLTGSRLAAVVLLQEDADEAAVYVAHRDDPERVRLRRAPANVEDLRSLMQEREGRLEELRQELLSKARSATLASAPIRVERRLRGVLLLAQTGDADAERRRLARAFARRFAVALGAEERRQALLRQAYYDELTGLPNRQLFKDRLQQELARARRTAESIAIIYVDLDRFKYVNDSLGHTAGDDLLKLVSWRLGAVVRDTDTLARLGGDEFVIIASGVSDSPAHVLAERLQDALHGVLRIRDVDCFIEASMGITVFPQDGATAEVLLRNADTAMYRAKALGGGRAVYFEEAMNRDATRRMHVERRLRAAIAREGLTLVYQPKIRLSDDAVYGVEALARWSDPELGPVSPAEFILVAEDCGLIDDIGEWALREACTTFQAWRAQGVDIDHISVNVSNRQLRDEQFARTVQRILHETQIPPGALELEVTESTLADSPRQVMQALEQVRDLGVRIAIDDFGVGYSSMAALGHLPAHVLKIDRSFIEHSATRDDAASVVEAIISMARALGKSTIAEGVEDERQLAVLKSLGCDVGQGYFFSRPLPGADIPAFVFQRAAVQGSVTDPASTDARAAGF
jgi:diguanylate cyclase